MDLGISGKLALIAGGSKGIGLACAHALSAEGARIALVSRSTANMSAALAELPGAIGVCADLADAGEALRALEEIEARLGPVDILVNSAGAARRTPPDDLDPGAYRAAMDAKFFTYVNLIDPAVKRMAERRQGVIVNVLGNGGKAASPVHMPGGAANAALMLVTAGMAAAYAGRGVRIVAVNPGLTETDRVAEGLAADSRLAGVSEEEARTRAIARIPMGRMARPQEIAAMVTFLASGQASYVTGTEVHINGGEHV